MAKIGFLLTSGPFQYQNMDTLHSLASAFLDKGSEVFIFNYLDGVYNPNKLQKFPDLDTMPKDKVEELVTKGAQVICCGVCVNARGLENGKDYINNVKVGGLPDFAEIVGNVDKLITL